MLCAKTMFPLLRMVACAAVVSSCFFVGVTRAAEPKLIEPLAPFAKFVGKTWKGEFKNSTKEKPMFDVSRWEIALQGKAIRVMHSVNDGVYGGESLLVWNAKKKALESFYFTTAGFYTQATIEIKDGKMTSREMVTGNAQGIEEVEATSEVREDGKLHVKSRYRKGETWVDGHEILYSESPDSKVNLE